MEPDEPAPPGNRPEARRPLLMDPAGTRPSGFAPPSVLTSSPAAAVTPVPLTSSSPGPPSVLAGPATTVVPGAVPGEASFGPVSQVVRVSVRTLSSRIDLVLPDRSSIAETLETVLELAPRTLREQAIAHGGWILRTAGGEALPGSTTLLDQGIVDGTTLFLTGLDAANSAAVYDDVADAVADTVRNDPSVWPARGGRAVALGAAGLFAGLTCLSLLWAGPPWSAVAITLGGIAVLAQIAAGLLSRGVADAGIAVVTGLFSVASATAAATVATAGSSALLDIGAPQLLLGAATATLFATTAALIIGSRRVPFVAIVTGSLVSCLALACCVFFELPAVGGAAIVAGTALAAMPAVPSAALALARFELAPLPPPDDLPADDVPDDDTLDGSAVRRRALQAVGYVTALIQGLSWPALVAAVILAFSQDITAQVLAGLVGVGLLLRARLFITIGQRLPLQLAGVGAIAAVLIALMTELDGATMVIAVALPALAGMIVCLLLAVRRRRVSPGVLRVAEIVDLLMAVAVVPLVAGVLGLFGFIRGLGG